MESFWRIFIEPMYQDRTIGEDATRRIDRLHPDVKRRRPGTANFHLRNRHFDGRIGFTHLKTWRPEPAWLRPVGDENPLPQVERVKLG